jgi:hypothetical protein
MDAKTATSKAETAFHIGDVAPDGHLLTLVMTSARVCAIYATSRRNATTFSTRTFCDFTERPSVRRLPVTLLICADELRIGQYVALHCSLDLRFRRVS